MKINLVSIAEMNGKALDLDYTPQCIVAFNKVTLKIDWHYRFEGDWIKNRCSSVFRKQTLSTNWKWSITHF